MTRLIFCLLYICNAVLADSVVVETSLGSVRGNLVYDEIMNVSFYSFMGIPYAEAPVGDLRWRPPVQIEAWSGVFNATSPGKVCPQKETYYTRDEMDEDCLNFNVYVPADALNKSLPVFLYIHGGGFDSQAGNAKPIFGPQLFVKQDMLVVTLNYRLGALGFLSFCTEEASGNGGLKDVMLLLKVVNENISKFGGDPDNVMIKGSGAGSAMIGLLMTTDLCNSTFQRVLMHGGTFLSSKFIQKNPRENAIALAEELGLDTSDKDVLLENLKSVDAFDVVDAQEAVSRRNPQRGYIDYKPFQPTVEIEHENAVLTKSPLELMNEGATCDIPILIGFNNQEGLEIYPLLKEEPELIDNLNNNFELCIPEDIQYPEGSEARSSLAAKIKDMYCDGENITFVKTQNFINLVSDSQFIHSEDAYVTLYKASKSSNVYYFEYSCDNELNWFKSYFNITYPGAAYLDDLTFGFVASNKRSTFANLSAATQAVLDDVLAVIKSFVYYGEPPSDISWPDTTEDHYYFAIRERDSGMVYSRPLPKRMEFWDSVYEEYYNSEYYTEQTFCSSDDTSSAK